MTQIDFTQAQTAQFTPSVYIAVYNNSNPGRTGWAAVWLDKSGKLGDLTGVVENCTNMRGEIIAATEAVRLFPSRKPLRLVCPSQYLLNYERSLPQWKQSDWKTAGRKPVANSAEWVAFDQLACRRTVILVEKNADARSLAGYARQLAASACKSGTT